MRFIVDFACDRRDDERRPLVIVVHHFPSERVGCAVYDSVPFNGWDMNFCDSFSLKHANHHQLRFMQHDEVDDGAYHGNEEKFDATSDDDEDEVEDRAAETATQEGTTEALFDDRRWLSIAFGLERYPDLAKLTHGMEERFLREVRSAVASTKCTESMNLKEKRNMVAELQMRGVSSPATIALYSNDPSKCDKIADVLAQRPYIMKALLLQLCKLWASELPRALDQAARDLVAGKHVDGLVDLVHTTLQWLVRAFARYSVDSLCNHYGTEAIERLPAGDAGGRAVEYLRKVLEAMGAPLMSDLHRLPLFLSFFRWAKLASGIESDEVYKLSRSKQRSLHAVHEAMQLCERDPQLFEWFVHDFVCCSLGYSTLLVRETPVIVRLVLLNRHPSVQELLNDQTIASTISSATSTMAPLRQLFAKHEHVGFFLSVVHECGDAASLLSAVEQLVITTLWRLGSDVDLGEAQSSRRWVAAIRSLSAQYPDLASLGDKEPMVGWTIATFKLLCMLLSSNAPLHAVRAVLPKLLSADKLKLESHDGWGDRFASWSFAVLVDLKASCKVAVGSLAEELLMFVEGAQFSQLEGSHIPDILCCLGSDCEAVEKRFGPCQELSAPVQQQLLISLLAPEHQVRVVPCLVEELCRRRVQTAPFVPE